MENNNYPSHPPMNSLDKPKRNNAWIYLGIILLLLATNIILFTQKSKTQDEKEIVSEQYEEQQVVNENLQIQYSAALARLDELTGENSALDKMIVSKDSEIGRIKSNIETILNDKKATDQDLAKARGLIKQLNTKITGYEQEIVNLKKENQKITTQRDQAIAKNTELSQQNDQLTEKVNIGKVLSVSNIRLLPVDLRRNGNSQIETSKAKRVDILRVAFDIDENLLTDDGTQEIYARIINPEGKLLTNAALGSGTFKMKDVELAQYYTMNKKIPIKAREKVRDVTMDWQQTAEYLKGNYTIELYNQGYMVGKQSLSLR